MNAKLKLPWANAGAQGRTNSGLGLLSILLTPLLLAGTLCLVEGSGGLAFLVPFSPALPLR
ncbi:hypothetical protein C7I86_16905 (plasmid) [Synechocystis sp. IPPAS B-1465]|nr:hypothetical protein C7I86_16905 [Synechocystis sp. IPPAS B-1465]